MIEFPHIIRSVNYDHEIPIPYSMVVFSEEELKQEKEECELYGYTIVGETEFTEIIGAL